MPSNLYVQNILYTIATIWYNIPRIGKKGELKLMELLQEKDIGYIPRDIQENLLALNITSLDELRKETYFSLIEKMDYLVAKDIVILLHPKGYFPTPDNEVYVPELDISSRLRNILVRAGILYLSQLQEYSRKRILTFRNMGVGTMNELEQLCEKYNINLWSSTKFNRVQKKVKREEYNGASDERISGSDK